jgi:adenylyltransferase/sulfurtransferase
MPTDTTEQKFRERYARQISLPGFGLEAQRRLGQTSVLIVGVGGLGAIAASYLAAAGVGRLGLVDDDTVALANLHRQILYSTEDADAHSAKTEAAQARLKQINPHCEVEICAEQFTDANANRVLAHYGLVIDGTDSHKAKYAINRACVQAGKPLVYGGVFRYEGQVSVFNIGGGPCLECVYPDTAVAPTSCSSEGVLGTVPGIIGIMQAQETIKWATGIGKLLSGKVLLYNGLEASCRTFAVKRNPECRACGR